jgi:hypothetical protein
MTACRNNKHTTVMQVAACMICSDAHHPSVCPQLHDSLRNGFFRGGGGGGGHSHEEDEAIHAVASFANRSASALPTEIASVPPVCPKTCTSCVNSDILSHNSHIAGMMST